MADWRQIQARIRKAKVGEDAPAKLTQLFDRTRDGMVAFELASLLEKNGRTEEAVQWYGTASQRFRRADWRQKAVDALTRLGAPIPERAVEPAAESVDLAAQADSARDVATTDAIASDSESGASADSQPETSAQELGAAADGRRKRRRGRRGGRGRNKRRGQPGEATSDPASAARPPVSRAETRSITREAPLPRPPVRSSEPEIEAEPEPSVSRSAGLPGFRSGDPALASRMVQLESSMRRLIASPVYPFDQVEEAPAGPGVFLLSDSDQVTHYYVEACQTLRIALGNLVKSGRAGSRENSFSLRPGLAEHLGISETKVKDYLRKHCVVRWLQMDEGAAYVAHFAIALLRPALNVQV